MSHSDPQTFAAEWIEAWNSRNLDRILTHYAPEIVFLSPGAQKLRGDGRVVGIDALRDYWRAALAINTDLKFELVGVLEGFEGLTVLYRNHRGQAVAETVEFDRAGKVVRSCACYAPAAILETASRA
ncbi:MAG: nuclear transport factor 2 family protein [Hyphomicrobiales bacterium]|nr:nuclear transport factor 2 family protein [Hyphomicrobiales bacterium]